MGKKYKFIGLSKYAERYLIHECFEELENMIGAEIEESDEVSEVDGGRMFIMPYGENVHIDFLIIEEIQPQLF